jgi:hypothetical protein
MRKRLDTIFLLLPVLSIAVAVDRGGGLSWQAAPMPEWDAFIQSADPAWRGADAAYSIPLSPEKTLWLFGDTWITLPTARGRKGGTMIRNSIALQRMSGDEPGNLEFFWRTTSGKPAAFLAPDTGPGWLWPLGGVRVGKGLCLFLSQLIESKVGLGFASYRSVLLVVPNADNQPSQWEFQQGDSVLPAQRER